jgi:hypothetical protein
MGKEEEREGRVEEDGKDLWVEEGGGGRRRLEGSFQE